MLFCSAYASAQAPSTLNYQGRLLQNTSDQAAVEGTIDVVFTLWSGSASDGSAVQLWSESWADIALSNGIFSVLLGSNGSPLDASDFQGDDSLYLQLEVDGEVLIPRQQLGSAPFAMVDEPGNEYQDLDLSGDELSLTNSDEGVDLSSYLDNTDNQALSLSGDDLQLSSDDGPDSVSLSGYLDNTDDQTLALDSDRLTTSGSGSTVSFATFFGNAEVAELVAAL